MIGTNGFHEGNTGNDRFTTVWLCCEKTTFEIFTSSLFSDDVKEMCLNAYSTYRTIVFPYISMTSVVVVAVIDS